MKSIFNTITMDSPALTFAFAFTLGYLANQILRAIFRKKPKEKTRNMPHSKTKPYEDEDEEEESEEDYYVDDIDDNSTDDMSVPYKMVLVINTELNMGKGKVAAQCAHAAVAAYKIGKRRAPCSILCWENSGQAKITVKAKDDIELLDILETAREAHLIGYIVHDAGRTQILAGSKTVCVVGPGPSNVIDEITGGLKLY